MHKRTAIRSLSVYALGLSAAFCPAPAVAREARHRVDIVAGNLTQALTSLSLQTGISFAVDSRLLRVDVRPLHGEMTAREGLDRLLRHTGLRAVRVGPMAYRVLPRNPAPITPRIDAPISPADIVVTARKQIELLSKIAAPVSVYRGSDDASENPASAHDVASAVDGLVLTHLGPGRDRLFIRGIADSPFNGFSQATVAVQMDDGRLTYDAADPNLRLVDIARVEVLKGPQGPLYGTGALGGVLRIVTNRPVLDETRGWASLGYSAVGHGGFGAMAQGVLNLPVIEDRVALRLVGYSAAEPGWIDDAMGRDNANQSLTTGGRIALRLQPAADWTVDLGATAQSIRQRDSQYVDSDAADLTRAVAFPEPRTAALELLRGTVEGRIGQLRFTAALSHTWQRQDDLYDASASAGELGVTGPANYRDHRAYRVLNQEVRLASAPDARLAWTAGLSYLAASTSATGTLRAGDGSSTVPFTLDRRVTETAIFGEGSLPLLARVRGAIGMRIFRATTDDARAESGSVAAEARAVIGASPSASLSFDIAPGKLLYARMATAFRPGGIDVTNRSTGRYAADEVTSVDLGTKFQLAGGRLMLDGDFFYARWSDVQSDYLEANGLLATRTAGSATIYGIEGAMAWQPSRGWRLEAGATLQQPRLTHAADGSDLPVDRRLPIVPDVSGRLLLRHEIDLGGGRLVTDLRGNLLGASRLSFDTGLDRRTPGYFIAGVTLKWRRGPISFTATVDNILDSRADTFGFGNPFSVRTTPQFTPYRPRTVSISMARAFR